MNSTDIMLAYYAWSAAMSAKAAFIMYEIEGGFNFFLQ